MDSKPLPAVTPSSPKTKTLQLGLGSSIMSSLRRGFREKSNSPARAGEMEDVGEISSFKSPEDPQSTRSPVKTPKLKSFKLALPSFLKKKPRQEEGGTRVGLPVKAITTITTATNNNNQSEAGQSQAQKKPVLSPTRGRARPNQGDSRTPRVLARLPSLSLTKPTQRKEEAESRRSLDQLTISGKSLGQIALKTRDPEKSNEVGEAEEDEVQQDDTRSVPAARPRSGLLSNLQKSAGLRKPLGDTLKKPKKAIAAAPEESIESGLEKSLGDTLKKPKKAIAPGDLLSRPILSSLPKEKPKAVVAAAREESIESVLGNDEEREGSQENQTLEWTGSPRQDHRQGKAATSMFSTPEQPSFLVSPTGGEDFFSDLGNDFSADFSGGFFGAGNDKEGDSFFASFDETLPEDGGFSFFGDSGDKDADNDFFFRGEEEDEEDNEDGGLNFF